MPGRLVERVRSSDKIIGGLHPVTPQLIERLYSRVVTQGTLYKTNSMTAEVVKTLENAYRDVRIAFAAEVVRWCDAHDMDFFALRDAVNLRVRQSDLASADATRSSQRRGTGADHRCRWSLPAEGRHPALVALH